MTLKNVWTRKLDVKKMLPNPFGWIHFVKIAPELKTFYFPDFFSFKDHQREKEFDSSPKALQKELNPDSRCPCGSGKKYSECHNPELIQNEKNLWRGPKFPQNIYLARIIHKKRQCII